MSTRTDRHQTYENGVLVDERVEVVDTTEDTNRATIENQAEGAVATNATYLSIGSPTNAQVIAQVRALTQQNNRIIRLALSKFDATD